MIARPLPSPTGSAPYAEQRTAVSAHNRLLPEGRLAGPMPWVIAIMMFLTVLATAAGLGLGHGLSGMQAQLEGKLTVQLIEPDAAQRAARVNALYAALRLNPLVRTVKIVPEKQLAEQIRPWLGEDIAAVDLPIPALIELTLAPGTASSGIAALRSDIDRRAPGARIDADAGFLAPVASLMRSLTWLAAALVLLMVAATSAVVVMAARGAHDAHRGTIEILHLLGSTDIQIARLFQRRMALDAAFGGIIGLGAAVLAMLALGSQLVDTRSELAQLVSLPPWGWALLPMVPIFGVLLAMTAARMTLRRALEQSL